MTDEMEAKAENCRLAMKAALEAIQDYCGVAPTEEVSVKAPGSIEFLGTRVKLADRIRSIAENQELTVEERITVIEGSVEARIMAEEMCVPETEPFSKREPGETEDGCIDRVAALFAEAVVRETESGTR